jgi:hypothetical protein
MSDFGTMLTVHRIDGAPTSASDLIMIKRLSKELVLVEDDRLSDYADFDLSFGTSDGGEAGDGMLVMLTQNWLADDQGNDGMQDESLIERDRPLAERFGEELQEKIGSEYKIKVYCGHW